MVVGRELTGRVALGTAAFVLVAVALFAQSPTPFAPLETPVPTGVGPPFGLGDVNGDGSLDLIVMGPPYVVLNDGHGHFTPAIGSAGGSAGLTLPLYVIADFNQDGRADLITTPTGQSPAPASFWMGTAAGTLVATTPPPLQQLGIVGGLAAGDVDGDGDQDLVCATQWFIGGQLPFIAAPTSVLLNSGSGTFTNAGSLGLPNIGAGPLALVDFDSDGDRDLVMSASISGLALAINNGGTFSVPPGYFGTPGWAAPLHVFPAKLNADTWPDFVVWAQGASASPPVLYAGGPGALTQIGTLPPVKGAAVFDLTGDGIPEFVGADDLALSVVSFAVPGTTPVLFKIDRPGEHLVSGDLDADGDADLLLFSRLVYTAWFSDGAGGLHRQGSGFEPRLLLGGPIALDLSGDGAPELVGVVAEPSGIKLAVAQNDGTGRFTWSTSPIAGTALPNATMLPVAADVNGDGLKDLVVVEGVLFQWTAWAVSVRVIANGGGGLWTAGAATPIGFADRFDAAAADLNGDGRDDLVLSDFTTGVRVILGAPGGLIGTGTVYSATPARRIALFDADGDLDVDVAIAGQPAHILLNDGTGAFSIDVTFPFVSDAFFVTAGDVDGDGDSDLDLGSAIYLHQGSSWLLLGTLPPPPFSSGGEARSFDFEGDGDVDTVVGSAQAYVWEANGVVSTHALAFPIFTLGFKLTPSDLDRDGDPDLVGTTPIDLPGNMPSPRLPVVIYNTARHLTQDSPARPGRPLNMGLHGTPGGIAFLYASAGTASIAMPPFGTLFIDPLGAVLLGSAPIPTGGSASVSIPVPPSAAAFLGTTFQFQGFLDTAAGPRLTNARRVTIVGF